MNPSFLFHQTAKRFLTNNLTLILPKPNVAEQIRYITLPLHRHYSYHVRNKLQKFLKVHFLKLRFRFTFTIHWVFFFFFNMRTGFQTLFAQMLCMAIAVQTAISDILTQPLEILKWDYLKTKGFLIDQAYNWQNNVILYSGNTPGSRVI